MCPPASPVQLINECIVSRLVYKWHIVVYHCAELFLGRMQIPPGVLSSLTHFRFFFLCGYTNKMYHANQFTFELLVGRFCCLLERARQAVSLFPALMLSQANKLLVLAVILILQM